MEATLGPANSSHCCLAPSGHQQVVLGTQWPLNSQKKGTTDPCLGVIRARGWLWGPLAITFPLEPLCLGTLGEEGPEAPSGVPLVPDPLEVVRWSVSRHPRVCFIYTF